MATLQRQALPASEIRGQYDSITALTANDLSRYPRRGYAVDHTPNGHRTKPLKMPVPGPFLSALAPQLPAYGRDHAALQPAATGCRHAHWLELPFTGGMHQDGLADIADGLGGRDTADRFGSCVTVSAVMARLH